MHFSQQHIGASNKFTKMAIVTALHVLVGGALIHNMNRVPGPTDSPPPITVTTVKPEKPVEPPPQPKPFEPVTVQPRLVIPEPFVVEPTPREDSMTADVLKKDAPLPPVTPPTVVSDPVPPPTVPPVARPAVEKRTAVLADASACVKPDYPARAARDGATGTVNLALLVGVDGKVTDARVDKSSGSRDLDKAAVAALSLCKFKPATVGGVAEPAWAQIAYVWTLD